MEANKKSWKRATQVLKSRTCIACQATVLLGYSSDTAVIEAIQFDQRTHPSQVVLQEIIGFVASSEGVATAIGHVKQNFAESASNVSYIPSLAATFYTLIYIDDVSKVVNSARELYVNSNACTLLVRYVFYLYLSCLLKQA